MSGNAADLIFLTLQTFFFQRVSFRKNQFHERFFPCGRKLALQLGSVLFVQPGTCFPVQGKNNSVKNRGFSRAGIPCYEKQVLICFCKIDNRPLPVGTEGLHGQLQRLHPCPTSCT